MVSSLFRSANGDHDNSFVVPIWPSETRGVTVAVTSAEGGGREDGEAQIT